MLQVRRMNDKQAYFFLCSLLCAGKQPLLFIEMNMQDDLKNFPIIQDSQQVVNFAYFSIIYLLI